MLDEELMEAYVKTLKKSGGFQERLRLAFESKRDVIKDFQNLVNYRRGDEDLEVFFKIVEDSVDRLLANEELTNEKMMAKMLIICSESKKVEEEKIMRKLEKVEDIKETIVCIFI